jgi:hypothetical protein
MKQIQGTTAAADIQAIQRFVVEQAFKGRIIVNVGECGPAIGMTPQSARNLYTEEKFPFPTFPLNGVRKVRVSDIIVVLSSIEVEPAQADLPVQPVLTETEDKRRPGRPRANAQIKSNIASTIQRKSAEVWDVQEGGAV